MFSPQLILLPLTVPPAAPEGPSWGTQPQQHTWGSPNPSAQGPGVAPASPQCPASKPEPGHGDTGATRAFFSSPSCAAPLKFPGDGVCKVNRSLKAVLLMLPSEVPLTRSPGLEQKCHRQRCQPQAFKPRESAPPRPAPFPSGSAEPPGEAGFIFSRSLPAPPLPSSEGEHRAAAGSRGKRRRRRGARSPGSRGWVTLL